MSVPPPDRRADLIVTRAAVWTGDSDRLAAAAFVVRDGRFVFVGDEEGALTWGGPQTTRVDAKGARIIPGICDAHLHLISGGLQLGRLNLRDAVDRSEFEDAIARNADRIEPGQWILGGRWSTESWPDPSQPRKEWIDPFTPANPVLLSRMDGHGALANSAALEIAGIDRDGPPDPPGGTIERDPQTGEPTGILKDAAIDLVNRHVPAASASQKRRALLAAMREANRHGVTSVHTMSPWSDLAILDAARSAGELTLRVRLFISEEDWPAHMAAARQFDGDAWLAVAGFKQFMDGSLGSRTAYMARPYADNTGDKRDWRGLLSEAAQTEGKLSRLCAAADAAGFIPAIHAIGDQANHRLLDIYESTATTNGPRAGRRMRVEHAQHLLPGDVARFAAPGLVASMQPLHKADDGRYAEKAIGAQRCKTSYAFRGLLDAGAHLAFGSDWPVVSLDPFRGIHAAVTGLTLDGKPFVPRQNITVEEALRAYTTGGAYAAGDEGTLGRIKVGYLADFVILQDDVLRTRPASLGNVRVQETYVHGARVWRR